MTKAILPIALIGMTLALCWSAMTAYQNANDCWLLYGATYNPETNSLDDTSRMGPGDWCFPNGNRNKPEQN